MSLHTPYRCIQCSGSLKSAGDVLACDACKATYPSIGGVDVLALNYDYLLRSCAETLSEQCVKVSANQAKLARLDTDGRSPTALSLAKSGYEGQLANLHLIEQVIAPVKQYIATHASQSDLFSQLFAGTWHWSSLNMLPYFCRDWSHAGEARFLTTLLAGAALRYCRDHCQSVAVLGCGACRLVYDIAEFFPSVFGLDLAIDSLLLAKAMLDGAEIELHCAFPFLAMPIDQKRIKLLGAPQQREGIRLVAADASDLPFPPASISCVITPYLLDIVPNPNAVMSEIRRVLMPEGVWINFSIITEKSSPRAVRSYDQLNNLDLPLHLRQNGFALLDQAMHRYAHLDMSFISGWAEGETHTPVFFAAQKYGIEGDGRRDPFAGRSSGQGGSIWDMTPKIVEYIGLMQESAFTADGVERQTRISVRDPKDSRIVPKGIAAIAEWLLLQIDGTHTTREIFALLCTQFADSMGPNEFLRFLRTMQTAELIELRTKNGSHMLAPRPQD